MFMVISKGSALLATEVAIMTVTDLQGVVVAQAQK
jgi:hypothetical protein